MQPYIEIEITNPTPTGGQPAPVRNEVWRSETGDAGSYVRLASTVPVGQPTLYRDYQVASGKSYWYFVRTYFDNSTTGDSGAATSVNTWNDYTWLGLPDGSAAVQFRWNPKRRESFKVESRLMEFDGREHPLGFAGIGSDHEWDINFMLYGPLDELDQTNAIRTLVDEKRGRTFMWRDNLGNLVYCWVDRYDRELGRPTPRSSLSFRLREVDYSVAV